MKVKNWFKTLLAGVGIGVASSIPGVSGGTIAVILKVYEKIVWAVSNIFKSFKKAIVILLPILLGVIIGMVPTIVLVDKALNGFVFGLVCIFAGFIIGSFPQITEEVKGTKPNKFEIITLVITLLITIGLGVLSIVTKADTSSHFTSPEWWFYLILIPVGFAASIALVVPGVSGGMILILLGFYSPLIQSTSDVFKQITQGDWSHVGIQVGIIGCFAIGVVLGFFFVSKLMNFLLEKYRRITFFGIIGFIIGSVVALFANFEIYSYYQKWMEGGQGYLAKEVEIPLGIALLLIFAVLAYLLVRYTRKHLQSETKEN